MRTTNVRAHVDAGLLIKDAAKLLPDRSRRMFLRNTASLGALALLTGCDIVDGPTSERALRIVSHFNDWVQARLFNPRRLADTYPESAITRPFPFNGYYPEEQAPDWPNDRRPSIDAVRRLAVTTLTGPGIRSDITARIRSFAMFSRSSNSSMRRAARSPGTVRSTRRTMWSDCSKALSSRSSFGCSVRAACSSSGLSPATPRSRWRLRCLQVGA